MVDVNSHGNSIKIDVSSGSGTSNLNISSNGSGLNINATPDTAMYYSNKSREYAESDKIIDGKYYSSKYYANKSKESAEQAKETAETITDTVETIEGYVEEVVAIKNDVETATEQAKQEITETSEQAKQDLANKGEEVKQDIEDDIKQQVDYINDGIATIDEKLNNVVDRVLSNQMFDVVQKDHVLTFEESKGLVAFGDYAYKRGSDGTRYGYPTFYERCIKEYNEAEDATLYTTRNYYIVDTSTDNSTFGFRENFSVGKGNANVSTFLGGRYLVANGGNTTLEINKPHIITFTTSENIATEQALIAPSVQYKGYLLRIVSKLKLWASFNGKSWGISEKTGTTTLLANTKYTVIFNWDGSTYTVDLVHPDGTRTTEISVANTNPIASGELTIGSNGYGSDLPFKGTIHLIENNEPVTYVTDGWKPYNNIIVKKHDNKHAYYDITNVDDIDYLYNNYKKAWLYGIDTTNERVRMPRNDSYFMNGVADEVGDMIGAGIPSFWGLWRSDGTDGSYGASGASYVSSTYADNGAGHSGNKTTPRFALDPARSSSIYGNSDTVQTDAVKLMGYICVGNTETEVSSTEVTEVTTTENDTLPLGFSDYFVVKPNHPSWLKSSYQFYDASIYETMYNWLVANKATNSSIKSVNGTYTDYDFVLDEVNMKFRLPLKNGKEGRYDVKVDFGEAQTIADVSGVNNSPFTVDTFGQIRITGVVSQSSHNLRITIKGTDGIERITTYTQDDTVTSASSWIDKNIDIYAGEQIVSISATCHTWSVKYYPLETQVIVGDKKADLYFKVANTVQNIELLNVGEVMEVVTDIASTAVLKTENKSYVTETYSNGTSWYRIYSNGWCEQGGAVVASGSKATTVAIELLVPYNHTDYSAFGGYNASSDNMYGQCYNLTNTGFTLKTYGGIKCSWMTCGYLI